MMLDTGLSSPGECQVGYEMGYDDKYQCHDLNVRCQRDFGKAMQMKLDIDLEVIESFVRICGQFSKTH